MAVCTAELALRFGYREDIVAIVVSGEEYMSGLMQQSASERSAAQDGFRIAESPAEMDAVVLPDLDRALLEAAEEMSFHWPEFLPAERIKKGLREIALGFMILAGLATLGSLFLLFRAC